GSPVVFLHGLSLDHTTYEAQFEDLPDAHRCIAVDLRGHGRSEFPLGEWSMQDFVDDVVAFVEGVEGAPCHLVGHSLGGMIAIAIAVERQDLLRSLVAIDTSADAEIPMFVDAMKGVMQTIEENGVEPVIEGMTNICFGPAYRESDPD